MSDYRPVFSIIICTYNRSDILSISLKKNLKTLETIKKKIEVIIVDNNSSDLTKHIIKKSFKNSPHHNLSKFYIFEKKQGLSFARNAGYRHARGQYILYLDDECIIPDNYLTFSSDLLKKKPAMIGGPYYGKFLPGFKSSWYKESFGNSYLLEKKIIDGELHNDYLCGGNMVIRRDLLSKLNGFNTSYGMQGDVIAYGEEQELQKRLKSEFPHEKIFYFKDLYVWHYIRPEKVSLRYMFTDALIRGEYSMREKPKNNMLLILSPFLLSSHIFIAFLSFLYRFIQSLIYRQHFFTTLHLDYRNTRWRSIGSYYYLTKKLFSSVSGSLACRTK